MNEIREAIERTDIELEKAIAEAAEEEQASMGGAQDWKALCKEAASYHLLSPEQEKIIYNRYKAGDEEAKDILINSNLRMVIDAAKNMYVTLKINGRLNYTTIYDLFQEGMLGLLKALEIYRPEENTKFSSYAYFWIQRYIKKEAYENNSSIIRIPPHVRRKMNLVNRAENALEQVLGREPAIEELQMQLDGILTKEDIVDALKIRASTGGIAVSLDTKIGEGEEEDETLESVIPDEKAIIPEIAVANASVSGQLKKMLNELTQQEQLILIRRFGLDGGETKTYREIGEELGGISKQRIKYVEERALKKLKKKIDDMGMTIADFI